MRRRITSFGAWLAVTAAAVALSWYAVRSVLRDTVFEPPRAPALSAQAVRGLAPDPAALEPAADTTISSTAQAAPTTGRPPAPPVTRTPSAPPPSGPSAAVPSAPASESPPVTRAATPTDADASPQAVAPKVAAAEQVGGSTRGFEVKGGRALFTFEADSATLVSATPNSGWSVKVWEGGLWLRVDFTRGDHTSSVFVVWIGHPPVAKTYES